ncbi:hypothetical protein JI752_018745 [Lysobacter sp. MMG2]|uniref:hypothetical protein n=1 Tax=Lysobacter sp. MMG2 TaxID=2801338 RepID=UPI001C216EBF|nr:hypothetical protein [Lysobacter sp. MMG2]MBU8978191.1 hypothetical protein [Lysobacter sp. MMG2]
MGIPASWQGASLPVLAEVCLAYFPYNEAPDAPGPVEHPVLVLAISRKDPFSLFVAYGTSQGIDHPHPWDLVLSKDEAQEIGLSKPTRFALDRTVWLPYDDVWFKRAIGRQTPRLGALPKAALKRLGESRITWEHAHQMSLIPGMEPKADLAKTEHVAPAISDAPVVEQSAKVKPASQAEE